MKSRTLAITIIFLSPFLSGCTEAVCETTITIDSGFGAADDIFLHYAEENAKRGGQIYVVAAIKIYQGVTVLCTAEDCAGGNEDSCFEVASDVSKDPELKIFFFLSRYSYNEGDEVESDEHDSSQSHMTNWQDLQLSDDWEISIDSDGVVYQFF